MAFFDTWRKLLLAGMVEIPAVFAFGLDVASGPPLMFITLPVVFQQMPFGSLFAVLFFIAVLFAALTSLMNLFETPIEAIENQFTDFKKGRRMYNSRYRGSCRRYDRERRRRRSMGRMPYPYKLHPSEADNWQQSRFSGHARRDTP